MTGKTHAAVGAGAALLGASLLGSDAVVMSACLGAIGGLLPDVDSKRSKAHQLSVRIVLGSVFGFCLLFGIQKFTSYEVVNSIGIDTIIGIAGFVTALLVGGRAPHRGMTHSFVFAAILSIAVMLVFKSAAFYFIIGYLSHLLIDTLNTKGEQLLWPLPRRFCFGLCKANGLADTVCYWLGMAACGVFLGLAIL